MIFYDCVVKVWKLLCFKCVGYGGIFDFVVIGVLFIVVGKVIRLL